MPMGALDRTEPRGSIRRGLRDLRHRRHRRIHKKRGSIDQTWHSRGTNTVRGCSEEQKGSWLNETSCLFILQCRVFF